MTKKLLTFSAICIIAVSATRSQAGVLTNGSLSVTIDGNGAIGTATFGGADYFNPGAPVSDFGFQNGTNTSTFRINTTTGVTGQPGTLTSTPTLQTFTGIYTGGGANVNFVRTYALVSGLNVLRVTTDLVNIGADLTLRYFDTFDPDQFGTPTFNDVFNLAGATVGEAISAHPASDLTVIAGSLDSRATVAAGSPFSIPSGTQLNDFFTAPFDGNGTIADQGLHIGLSTFLASGGSTSFTYDLAFGLNSTDARDAFTSANTPAATATPEPGSIILLATGGIGLVGGAVRRRRARKTLAA